MTINLSMSKILNAFMTKANMSNEEGAILCYVSGGAVDHWRKGRRGIPGLAYNIIMEECKKRMRNKKKL